MVELLKEVGSFTNTKGELIEYARYYVMYGDVRIYVKPVDTTGREILESLFK